MKNKLLKIIENIDFEKYESILNFDEAQKLDYLQKSGLILTRKDVENNSVDQNIKIVVYNSLLEIIYGKLLEK